MHKAAELKRQMDAAQLGNLPEGTPTEVRTLMETVKRFVQFVDREKGTVLGLAYCKTEEDLRRAHEALNAMSPGEGEGRRTSVEMYEVLLDMSFA
jgi:hypothetical protein